MKQKLNVVIFAGGRGSATIIESLMRHAQLNLCVLANAYDDGLSTGELRRFIPGMLGPSDIRKNIARTMPGTGTSSSALKRFLELRLNIEKFEDGLDLLKNISNWSLDQLAPELANLLQDLRVRQAGILQQYFSKLVEYVENNAAHAGPLNFSDMSLGNLLFSGCYLYNARDFNLCVDELNSLCETQAQVLNITAGKNHVLVGVKEDGSILNSEVALVSKQSQLKVEDIFLLESYLSDEELAEIDKFSLSQKLGYLESKCIYPDINPKAKFALEQADIIIYGPGTQHSSLFPSYVTNQVGEVIAANNSAEKIFISNILADHEIKGETANSLTQKLLYYLSRKNRTQIAWQNVVTTFFFQTQSEEQAVLHEYVKFNSREFGFPPERVILANWEATSGGHLGGQVVDELISIVNSRLQYRLRPYHHTVSIIVPGLDESRTVHQVLRELTLLDLQPFGVGKEIIFVDGGSQDNTLQLAKTVRDIKCFGLKRGSGRGEALRHGIEQASGNIIVFFPSDAEYIVEDLKKVISALLQSEYKVVFGSRATKCVNLSGRAREIYGSDWFGYYIGKYGGIMISIVSLLLYNRYVSDALTGIKGFNTRLLKSLMLVSKGVDLDMEIIAKIMRRGEFILEIPVDFKPRTRQQGKKTTIVDGLKGLWALARFYWAKKGNVQTLYSHSRI